MPEICKLIVDENLIAARHISLHRISCNATRPAPFYLSCSPIRSKNCLHAVTTRSTNNLSFQSEYEFGQQEMVVRASWNYNQQSNRSSIVLQLLKGISAVDLSYYDKSGLIFLLALRLYRSGCTTTARFLSFDFTDHSLIHKLVYTDYHKHSFWMDTCTFLKFVRLTTHLDTRLSLVLCVRS
jgi:hypothetical protein